jgi:hypothetical protein
MHRREHGRGGSTICKLASLEALERRESCLKLLYLTHFVHEISHTVKGGNP